MTTHGFHAGVARVSRELAPWLRMWAVARRHAYVLYRSPHRLFDVTVWPIVDTVLFGSLGVYFVAQGGPDSAAQAGVAYLLSGIVLWHVVYQAQIAVSTGFPECCKGGITVWSIPWHEQASTSASPTPAPGRSRAAPPARVKC